MLCNWGGVSQCPILVAFSSVYESGGLLHYKECKVVSPICLKFYETTLQNNPSGFGNTHIILCLIEYVPVNHVQCVQTCVIGRKL